MPNYRYLCSNCGHEFVEFQKMSDEKLKRCPKCSQDSLERVIGKGLGIVYKCDGFYTTDYAKKKKDGNSSSKENG